MGMYTKVLCLLFLNHLGSAIFTTNPTNVTTCLGSPAMFTCVIDETIVIGWLINGQQPSSPPPSRSLTPGPGLQSSLTVSGTSQLNGSYVQCYYLPPGSVTIRFSPQAYLSVQAPPAAPTNLTNTPINATSTILAWGPPPVQSPSLLSYVVEVSNGSGVLVYRGTVTVPQVTITTPDPCDQYEATVSAQYMMPNLTCTGNSSSSKSLGAPPSVIQPTTSLMFPMSPQDTVTVNISLPYQSGVCYYKTVAISGSGVYSFPSVKPLPQNGGKVTITISLPPNKHFNLIITASNGYGNTTSSVVISTFGVIGISANTTSPTGLLVCLFNPGSLATGCLVYLTDTATGVTYCRVVGRSLDTLVNIPFSPSNGPLGTGVYSVVVYVIESDGSVSSVPAITGEVLSVIGPSTIPPEPSTPNTPNTSVSIGAIIGAVVGGIVGIIIIITIIIIMIVVACTALYIRKIKRRMIPRESGFEPDEGTQSVLAVRFENSGEGHAQVVSYDSVASRPPTGGQPSQNGQYADIDITKRPFIAPSEGSAVEYAKVKPQGKAPHTKDQELGLSAHLPLDKELQLSTDEKGPEKPKDQDKEQRITYLMEQLFERNEELLRLRARDTKLETFKEQLQNIVQRMMSVIQELPTKDQELSAKKVQLSEIARELDTMVQSIDGHLIHIVKNLQGIRTGINATAQEQAMSTVTQQRQDMDSLISNKQINITPPIS